MTFLHYLLEFPEHACDVEPWRYIIISIVERNGITWTVGGALSVDETAITQGKWDVLDKKIFDCVTQPEPVSIIFV